MEEKLQRYYELKNELKKYRERPIGDRIKSGGLLEKRISEVFNNDKANKILKRSVGYNQNDFEKWESLRKEFIFLGHELEELGFNEEIEG